VKLFIKIYSGTSLHTYFYFFSLPNIIDEIAKEDEEKEKRRIRRTVIKEERLKSGPPRLGRYKYSSKLTD
jgi:hypothetical protein